MATAPTGFWRLVAGEAWKQSRAHFSWAVPTATFIFAFLLTLAWRAEEDAVDLAHSTVVSATAAVIVGVAIYCLNFIRAAERLYEREQDKVRSYSELSRRLAKRSNERRAQHRSDIKALRAEHAAQLARIRDERPQADARFVMEPWKKVYLEVENVGAAGNFWVEVSTEGFGGGRDVVRRPCLFDGAGQPALYLAKGARARMLVAYIDDTNLSMFWWNVNHYFPGLIDPVQPARSNGFMPDNPDVSDVEIIAEWAIYAKPDMPDGVMRRRLRMCNMEVFDLDGRDQP